MLWPDFPEDATSLLRRVEAPILTETGAEQNTMTIVMMPSEFVNLAAALAGKVGAK